MAPQDFTDEVLMAYVDGELDDATLRAVDAAASTDPAVAKRIALFRATRDRLAEMAATQGAVPVPDELMDHVRATLAAAREAEGSGGDSTKILSFAPRPAPAKTRPWRMPAIAASLALAVGLGGGMLLGRAVPPDGPAAQFAGLAQGGVAAALSRLKAGEEAEIAAGNLAVIASFRTADDEFCREFELSAQARGFIGVACAGNAGWDLRFAAASDPAGAEGYAPAGTLEALEVWLAGIGAGAPLAPEAEAEVLHAFGG